jgi:tryptophan-specific transport protein
MKMNNHKPTWHGILLVAGGAIGAGMFALPMVSAGAWMLWSTLGFLLVWYMTSLSASLFAKVNLALVADNKTNINDQSSFDSIVHAVMGSRWATLNNLSIMFIMMILMYAYISAGASIVAYSFESIGLQIETDMRKWLSLCFALIIALIVWLGTSIVSRVILVLMIGMALTFTVASRGIIPSVDFTILTSPTNSWSYLFAALPVYVTAFACGGLVPSLVRHYEFDPAKVYKSLLWGTLLALLVYLFWLSLTLGSIGRNGFIEIFTRGGNIGDLVKALVSIGVDPSLQARLNIFSHCAIITSFLSVGLGLFHFIQDKLCLGDSAMQRLKAIACCFVPPALGSFFLPYGFVHAISYAGLFVACSFFILPGVMAMVTTKKGMLTPGIAPYWVIIFGAIIVGLKCALIFDLLPQFA